VAWLILLVAGLFEVGWAVGLKYTEGFTRIGPTIFTIVALLLSMTLLALAMRSLPLSTSYAVWTGVGIIGTALFGFLVLKEPATLVRVVCIALIALGIAGLRLSAAG
jgi:quaternary ammonium compound-resistance protein SugE